MERILIRIFSESILILIFVIYDILHHLETRIYILDRIEIKKVADPDLFLAFGNVSLSVAVEFLVHRSGLVEQATFTNGVLDDLFDFYHGGPDAPLAKPAARVQAGYNTLGEGGRVYRSKVHFAGQMNNGPFQIW